MRVAFDGPRLKLDRARRLAGRGAYVHAVAGCVTVAGLARSLKRQVTPDDVKRIVTDLVTAVTDLSRPGDNSCEIGPATGDPAETPADLSPGLADAKPVETSSSDNG